VVDDTELRHARIVQFRYDYSLSNNFSIQIGLRKQTLLFHMEYINYYILRDVYNANKIDLTFLFVPVRHEKYNVKIGAGIDVGKVSYYNMSVGKGFSYYTDDNEFSHTEYYWRYRMAKGYEPGIHFIIQGNYYFSNKVFIAGQILLNQVSDKYPYKGSILAQDILSVNAGIGYRF
jgi:hypothetical protein